MGSHDSALHHYDVWLAEHPSVTDDIRRVLSEELNDAGISYDQVSVRIKDRRSFLTKLRNPDFPDYRDFESAHDVIGIRITVFTTSEIPLLVGVMRNLFAVEDVVDKAEKAKAEGTFGYASRHIIARVDPERLPELTGGTGSRTDLTGRLVEVQLRTVLQHAWAEFEHDIRYKNPDEDLPVEVHRAFTLAAGLIELADSQFDEIQHIVSSEVDAAEDAELSVTTLPGVLTMILGTTFPTSKADYYAFAVDMLAAHGITTIGELATLCDAENVSRLMDAMDYGYAPGQVRLIDDLLLMVYGRDHIRRTVHIGDNPDSRPGRLGNRWQRLTGADRK
ncbi:GTP pyrophosphokinase [Corynebacterium variabile]|uniref:GTP pyrophosphokinase n=1 Tax=Corynebacterium variabile TaxID=1727 RepID=UPI003A90FC3A